MGAMIRILFPLIGYLATATLITLALGGAYLWQTGRLTDDKVFELVALVQGVDLQQIAATQEEAKHEVPLEEPSIKAVLGQQQLLNRNLEVKLLALERGRQEYEHRLQQLKEQSERFDRLARDWEQRLTQEEELSTQESLGRVVNDLEQVTPETAKELLMRWIDEDRMDDVITILGRMSDNKKKKILQTFATPKELDKLHEIHLLMVEANAFQQRLEQARSELEGLNQ